MATDVSTPVYVAKSADYELTGPLIYTAASGSDRVVLLGSTYYNYANYVSAGAYTDIMGLGGEAMTPLNHDFTSNVTETPNTNYDIWMLADPNIPSGEVNIEPASSTPSVSGDVNGLLITVSGVNPTPTDFSKVFATIPVSTFSPDYVLPATGASVGDLMIGYISNNYGNNYTGLEDWTWPVGWTKVGEYRGFGNAYQSWAYKICDSAGEGVTVKGNHDATDGANKFLLGVTSFAQAGAGTTSISNDSELQWDILKLLNADSDLRWDIRQSIVQDSDLRWNVLQTVQHDSDLRWSVLANVIKDTDLRWSILKLINKDSDLRWSVLQIIYRDLELRWDSDGSNSTVFSDSTLQWSIIATIAQSLTLNWNVLQTITQDADIRWAILSAVAKDFEARWDVLQALHADATIEWNIIGTASKTITLRWNIQSDTNFEDISGIITVNSATAKITALSKTPVITTL